MEVILLYWDNLDDLAGAALLKAETLRRIGLWIFFSISSVALFAGAVFMALREPAFGLASATRLFTTLLYRRVTMPPLTPQGA